MVKVNELRIDEKDMLLYIYIDMPISAERVRITKLEDYLKGNFEDAIVDYENDGSDSYSDEIILEDKHLKSILVLSVYGGGREIFKELALPIETIYKKSICYLKELNSSCELPKGFINYILLTEYIYRSKDYDLNRTLKYWNMLIANVKPENPCNCG